MNSSSPLRKRSHRKSGRRGGSFLPEVSGALPPAPPPGADRELAEAFNELSVAYADLQKSELTSVSELRSARTHVEEMKTLLSALRRDYGMCKDERDASRRDHGELRARFTAVAQELEQALGEVIDLRGERDEAAGRRDEAARKAKSAAGRVAGIAAQRDEAAEEADRWRRRCEEHASAEAALAEEVAGLRAGGEAQEAGAAEARRAAAAAAALALEACRAEGEAAARAARAEAEGSLGAVREGREAAEEALQGSRDLCLQREQELAVVGKQCGELNRQLLEAKDAENRSEALAGRLHRVPDLRGAMRANLSGL